MANKRPKPEEIVTKLRQVEVLTGQGMPRLDAIRQIPIDDITEQVSTVALWKTERNIGSCERFTTFLKDRNAGAVAADPA